MLISGRVYHDRIDTTAILRQMIRCPRWTSIQLPITITKGYYISRIKIQYKGKRKQITVTNESEWKEYIDW